MTAILEALQWAVAGAFVLLGAVTVVGWVRHRSDRSRLYLALAVTLLGGVALAGQIGEATGYRSASLGDASLLFFVGSGYCFLRFRHCLIPLPRRVLYLAGVINLLAAAAVLAARLPTDPLVPRSAQQRVAVGLAVIVWCVCTGEPVVRLWLVARTLPAVQRARVRALASAYSGLIAILLFAGLGDRAAQAPAARLLVQSSALLLIPFLYVSFVPPRWVRRAWRGREEEAYREATLDLLVFTPEQEALARSGLDWAMRLVGASSGFLAMPTGERLVTIGMTEPAARDLLSRAGGDSAYSILPIESDGAGGAALVVSLPSRFGQGKLGTVPGPFTPLFGADETGRLVQYAAALTAALDRVQFTRLITLLQGIATTANETDSIEEASARVIDAVRAYTGWPVGRAFFPEGGSSQGLAPLHVWSVADAARFAAFREVSQMIGFAESSVFDGVLRTNEQRTIPDVTADPLFVRAAAARDAGLMGGFWFPVAVRHQAVGVLEFFASDNVLPDFSVLQAMGNIGAALGRVVERDRSIRRLEAARMVAESASEAKSEYLSRMSHELRTPMTAILGFTELLELDAREEDRAALTAILRAGDHLLSLINDVLDIARIESGKDTLSVEPVRVGPILEESFGLVEPLAGRQGSTVVIRVDDELLFVLADGQRLKQVLVNLLSNAVKYAGRGASITLFAEGRGADLVRIGVSDDGPGISADKVDRVFDPFDRLGAERTTVEGTGLGLALVRQLAQGMGGVAGVDTAEGTGSTFWCELSRAPTPDDVTREGPRSRAVAQEIDASAGKSCVLYVEDNLATINVMERLFELRPNVTLVTAMQGSLAMELAREHHPDLILLDLHLPDIQGDEVLRQLKQDVRTADVPVVMFSADATAGRVERLLAAGAREYLTKPVRVAEFLRVLDEILAPDPG